MFKFIEKHPFVAGFITGFIGVGFVGRGIKKLIKGKITIIQFNLNDIPKNNLTFGEVPNGDKEPKATVEN